MNIQDSEVLNIDLLSIKELIPGILLRKFHSWNIKTIKDLNVLDVENFSNRKGVGTKAVDSFINLVTDLSINTEKYYDFYIKNKGIVIPEIINEDDVKFIQRFRLFISEYLRLVIESRNFTLLLKRFGIDGSRYTLAELGLYYDLSRERVRQIVDRELNKLLQLMNGNKLKGNNVLCNKELVNDFRIFQANIIEKKIISFNKVEKILIDIFNVPIQLKDINHLEILMKILGFELNIYLETKIFFKEDEFNFQFLKVLFNQIYDIMEKHIYPLEPIDLVIRLKKMSKFNHLKNEIILDTLESVNEFEKLIVEGKTKYQLKLEYLSTIGDMGIRVLYDSQKSLHYSEILRQIKSMLAITNSNKNVNAENLKSGLINDQRTVPSGKSGFWSLKEWEIETKGIAELIINTLNYYNIPLDIKTIVEYISKKRPEINSKSIRSITYLSRNLFIRLIDGKIILKEWESNYKDQIKIKDKGERNTVVYDDYTIMEKIISIFEEEDIKEIKKSLLKFKLSVAGINLKESTFYSKMNKYPIFKNVYNGIFCLADDYKLVLNDNRFKTKKLKSQVMTDSLISYLNENKGKVLQRETVNYLVSKFDYPRTVLYKIIGMTNDIAVYEDEMKRKWLRLLDSKVTKNEIDFDIEEIIKNGETHNTEFKSSLRWDLKENRINKNLEFDVIKAIAAFLNTDGGNLLIGVRDDKSICGLENDLRTFKIINIDNFQRHLNRLISQNLGADIHRFIKLSFKVSQGKTICIINISKSIEPQFIKKDSKQLFYIRLSGESVILQIDEAIRYINSNWANK